MVQTDEIAPVFFCVCVCVHLSLCSLKVILNQFVPGVSDSTSFKFKSPCSLQHFGRLKIYERMGMSGKNWGLELEKHDDIKHRESKEQSLLNAPHQIVLLES